MNDRCDRGRRDGRGIAGLLLLVPALVVLQGALLGAAGLRTRIVLRALLLVSVAWNVMWIVRLARDFGSMAPVPMW